MAAPREYRVLHPDELQRVLADLRGLIARDNSRYDRLALVIFRLSCCCGLRVGEICGLDMEDLRFDHPVPSILVRAEVSKRVRTVRNGQRISAAAARVIRLAELPSTLQDLRGWWDARKGLGTTPDSPFVCSLSGRSKGHRLHRTAAARYWQRAIRCLGTRRGRELSIHTGRHTSGSVLHQAGWTVAEVQQMLGHVNLGTTTRYLHPIPRTDRPDPFGQG